MNPILSLTLISFILMLAIAVIGYTAYALFNWHQDNKMKRADRERVRNYRIFFGLDN